MTQRTATFSPPSSHGLEQMCCGTSTASGSVATRRRVWFMTAATPNSSRMRTP